MKRNRLLLLLPFFLYFHACQTWQTSTDEEGITIFEKGDTVLFYRVKTKSQEGRYPRADYIHPLYNLEGTLITEDFPEDHLHHRGVFWTWHQLRVGSKKIGDPWIAQDFVWDVYETETVKGKEGSICLDPKTYWKSPVYLDGSGSMRPLVREEASMTVHPARKKYRILDFELRFYALVDSLMIGGSEDEKGYSGFSVRVELGKDLVFTGENGMVEPQNLAVEAGSWVDISGEYPEGRRGITLMDHPGNPGFPQAWILRREKSMQNPKYPGRQPVIIPVDRPLVLKYRLVIHGGDLDSNSISSIARDFRSVP